MAGKRMCVSRQNRSEAEDQHRYNSNLTMMGVFFSPPSMPTLGGTYIGPTTHHTPSHAPT